MNKIWRDSDGKLLTPDEAGKAYRKLNPQFVSVPTWAAALEYSRERQKERGKAVIEALEKLEASYSAASLKADPETIYHEMYHNKALGVQEAIAWVKYHLGEHFL